MPDCSYRDFEIHIVGESPPYTVTAFYDGQSAYGRFSQSASQRLWHEYLSVLSDMRKKPGRRVLTSAGSLLFNELMQGEVRDLWIGARADLRRPAATRDPRPRLRIQLLLMSPAVAALPWESLYDPDRGRALGADEEIALVRVANQVAHVEQTRTLAVDFPIRILLVAVDDPYGIDSAHELQVVRERLSKLGPKRVSLSVLDGPVSIQQLHKRLEAESPHILHVMSHGEPDSLLLWSESGQRLENVYASQIQAAVRRTKSIRLVFLNACLAGQPDDRAPFDSVAHRLLQTGVPAVIAMQFEIMDPSAIRFAGYLYEQLVDGPCIGAVDAAVGSARNSLYIDDSEGVDYLTPVLWLNAEDGLIFQPRPEIAHTDHPDTGSTPALDGEPVAARRSIEPPALEIDLEALEQWIRMLPNDIPMPMRYEYRRRRRRLEKLLEQIRFDLQQQEAGILNYTQARNRLHAFSEERMYMENFLDVLKTAG